MSAPSNNGTEADSAWSWPPANKLYCETSNSVIPGVAEFSNAISAVAIIAAGLVPLLTSQFADEVTDLASAACAINGVFSFLVHAFPNRFFGTLDHISIMFMSLLYLKALLLAQYPRIYQSRVKNAAINLALVLTILVTFAWNEEHVPEALLVDPVVVTGPLLLLILTYLWGKLMCSDSSWHVGQLKRVILRAFVAFVLACLCWFAEELGFTPCPSVFTLHWLWHVLSAYALLGWACFAKYHRGRFFGFEVAVKGHWLCPYVCWTAPARHNNPIIRHSACNGEDALKNSYVREQYKRPTSPWSSGRASMGALERDSSASRSVRQLWRGGSFFKPETSGNVCRRASLAIRRGSAAIRRGSAAIRRSSQRPSLGMGDLADLQRDPEALVRWAANADVSADAPPPIDPATEGNPGDGPKRLSIDQKLRAAAGAAV